MRILAPGINSCQSIHAGLFHIPLQWIKPALKLLTQRTIHSHLWQKTSDCKTGFPFPETVSEAVSAKKPSAVLQAADFLQLQFQAGLWCRWGSMAPDQAPVPSRTARSTAGYARLLDPVPVRLQLETGPSSCSTEPLWTSSPASSWETPNKMKGVIAFWAGRLIQATQRTLTPSSSNTYTLRRKIIRQRKVRSASISNMHCFPSSHYLQGVLGTGISFKLPCFLASFWLLWFAVWWHWTPCV